MTLTEIAGYLVAQGLAATFLPTPEAPVVTPQGTPGVTTYRYVIVARNQVGATVGSPVGLTTTGNATLSATNYNALVWPQIPLATRYDVHRTVGGPTQGKIATTLTWTLHDTGLAGDSTTAPVSNTAATDIVLGYLPDAPDACLCLVPIHATQPSVGMFGSTDLYEEYPAMYLQVRGDVQDLDGALARAQLAYIALARIQATTLNGTFYTNVRVSTPMLLAPDKNRRPLVAVPLRMTKKVSA